MPNRRRPIAVVLNTHMTCYRELLRGVNAFANAKASWEMHFYSPFDDYVGLMKQYPPEGLLLGPLNELGQDEQAVAQVNGRRCVGVCRGHRASPIEGMIEILSDDERVGETAARHFLQKGYRQFAFVGNAGVNWSVTRGKGFEREVTGAGCAFSALELDWEPNSRGRGWDQADREGRVVSWLRTLPRPLALLACNDIRASAVAQICRNEGIGVPEDVAILGVDNDDLDCELSDPPLSSVAIPWRRIGYDAASLLDRILEGRPVERGVITVPPLGVIERQSTNSIAISDEDVVSALRFIREHAHERIGVEDVLQAVPVGRRALEKRFQSILHRTPLEEIRRVHIERAKQLLATTDLSIREVAASSGFGLSTWFSEAFHDMVGESPAQYRKRYQRL